MSNSIGRKFLRSRWIAGAVFALVTPHSAAAYCRLSSCELGRDDCAKDENGCVTSGNPQHWDGSCLSYAVQGDGSPARGVAAEDLARFVGEAFETWRSVECEGGGNPSFDAVFQGFVGCGQKDTVCTSADANVNVVMFHDHDWPNSQNPFALGATTTTGNLSSGRLIDADIELNSERYAFASDGSSGTFSLRRTLLHEVGHFLGLDHSTAAGSIMAEAYEWRADSLGADDVRGICAIFPPSNASLRCASSKPAYDQCKAEESCEGEVTRGGCSVSQVGRGALPEAMFIGVVGVAWAASRRRRGDAR